MSYEARALANAILDIADNMGLSVTNMALNKILYFSHGWYLASKQVPLIDREFEAWEHGPVLPIIYHQFKGSGDRPITARATMIDIESGADHPVPYRLSKPDGAFIHRMTAFYGARSAITLSMMSHEPCAPWAQVRFGETRPGMVISNDLIRRYFVARLTRENRADVH